MHAARPRTAHGRRPDAGFSIVEVIIAMLVLAVVVAAGTAMFGSSRQAASLAKVRDEQTAVANEALAKLQSDASWAVYCRTRGTNCDLNPWIASQPHLRNIGIVRDERGVILRFRVSGIATGVDLGADGQGRNDKDGLVPDMYRVRITIAPDASLLDRFPGLRPTTIQQETNPQIRVEKGRVTVNVCMVLNQVDERVAAGDCGANTRAQELLPPAELDTSSDARIRSTCRGNPDRTGSDERDCVPYKCSERAIAAPNPGLQTSIACASQGGWAPRIFTRPFADEFTEMRVAPGTGTVRLRHRNGTIEQQRLVGGSAQFTNLQTGMYEVLYDPPGNYRPWKSKSVPSSGLVSVEPGLNSRAVLMYRPNGRATVRVNVHSVDNSGPPWEQRLIDGYVGMNRNGTIVQGGTEELFLVPAPQGRMLTEEKPGTRVRRSLATDEFIWRNVEPGLYSFQMSDPSYSAFKSMSNTAGFFYVFPDGRVYYGESTEPPEYVNGLCAQDVRQVYVANGPIANPDTGVIWRPTPCNTPSGPPGPGGSSGGGTA